MPWPNLSAGYGRYTAATLYRPQPEPPPAGAESSTVVFHPQRRCLRRLQAQLFSLHPFGATLAPAVTNETY